MKYFIAYLLWLCIWVYGLWLLIPSYRMPSGGSKDKLESFLGLFVGVALGAGYFTIMKESFNVSEEIALNVLIVIELVLTIILWLLVGKSKK